MIKKLEWDSADNASAARRAWPADRVERRKVADLVPYARNARTHGDEQVAQIAASIREWGWTMPILVDEDGGILAGHGRILAARRLGIDEVPALVARGWSEAQKRAYILADNKLSENAGWDKELLRLELADLDALGFDLPMIGFSDREIRGLMTNHSGLTDPDEAPEAPQKPVSAPGDVWLLGPHRLVCGDSGAKAAADAAMNGTIPHLMVTDPPYGVDYDPEWRKKSGLNTGGAYGTVENDDQADWRAVWALFPGDVAYVWHAGKHAAEVTCWRRRSSLQQGVMEGRLGARMMPGPGKTFGRCPCPNAFPLGTSVHSGRNSLPGWRPNKSRSFGQGITAACPGVLCYQHSGP